MSKDTVDRRVCCAPFVFPNDPVEYRAPFGQPFERADLISTHETAVAFDICWHPSYCRHHALRSVAVDAIDPAGAVRQAGAGVGADANHGVVSRRSVIAAISVFARLGSTA